jgi:hypothetical protein
MKKLTILITTILIIHLSAFSQPCFPDGITFSTQEQIDNFQINYPNCTEVIGYLLVQGDEITNLDGLDVITAVYDNL